MVLPFLVASMLFGKTGASDEPLRFAEGSRL